MVLRVGFTRNSRSPLEFSITPSPRLVFELESVSFIEAKSTLAMNATATTLHLFLSLSLSLSNYLCLSLSVFSRFQRRNFLMAPSLAAEPRPRRIVMSLLLLLLLLAKRACLRCARRGWRRLPDDRGEVNCVSLLALDLF